MSSTHDWEWFLATYTTYLCLFFGEHAEIYPLVIRYVAIEHGLYKIVSLSIEHGDFPHLC